MKRIRTRSRIDTLANQQRADPVRWGRRVYLAILAGLLLLGLDYLFGDRFILGADGMVVNDHQVVAATYNARVARSLVREGQRVAVGDLLLELESPDMLKDIAEAAAHSADLATRRAQLMARVATLGALLPLSERQAEQSAGMVSRMDALADRGAVSWQSINQALASEYDSAARLAELRTEARMAAEQLPVLDQEIGLAHDMLHQLQQFYDNGRVRAVSAGTVGTRVPVPGQVVRFGDDLLQTYRDAAHVIAYLPDGYLFALHPGQHVTLTGGADVAQGTVEALLPVTEALPPEFQNMFRPRDRGRLVRIRLPAGQPFAVAQKVHMTGCAFGWCWLGRSAD
jgi:multidrug resistance efflux pump